MSQVETREINKVRDLAVQVSRELQVPDSEAEDARDTIRTICSAASKYGLTTADVVRAIFRPALETRSRGCGCPTCQSRRSRLGKEKPSDMSGLVNQLPSTEA